MKNKKIAVLFSLILACALVFQTVQFNVAAAKDIAVKGVSYTAVDTESTAAKTSYTFVPELNINPTTNWEASAQEFMNGSFEGYNFGKDQMIDWNLPSISDRSTKYLFHGMFWLQSLLMRYYQTKNPTYVKKALPYIFDYISKYPKISSGQPEMVWHDDGAARRTYYLLQVYDQWGSLLTSAQKTTLANYLKYSAKVLALNSFFKPRHNHGLFQDRGLLYYTVIFPKDPNNKAYRNKVKTRIQDYTDHMVFKDGAGAEHSPSYLETVACVLNDLASIYKMVDTNYSAQLTKIVNKIATLMVQIVQPDGTYPQIGDTARYMVDLSWVYGKMSSYQYVLNKGAKGSAPKATYGIFPYGGYAIFRKDWTMNGTSDYALLTAATHGTAHKHYDDLNYIIYHGGELINEGGADGYNYSDKLIKYSYSPWAHNVMIANWDNSKLKSRYSGMPVIDANALKTKLTDWDVDDTSLVSATGMQQCIKGITQTRKLSWDKAKNVITIKDSVKADKTGNKYLFLMHLADGVTAKKGGSGYYLIRNGKKVATVTFKSTKAFTVIQGYGDQDPIVKGWDVETRKPVWVLAVRFNKMPKTFDFTTTVKLLPLS